MNEPTTLDDLFNRDPITLSDFELEQMVTVLREKRATWAAEEESANSGGRRANPNKGVSSKVKVTLGDLDISL